MSELFIAAKDRGRALLGIPLDEVGNLSDLVDEQRRQSMSGMLAASFRQSCSEEPHIYWSQGETVAACRPHFDVESLPTLSGMKRIASWRAVDRFALSGAAEHGRCKLRVFNQHQPQSDMRPLRAAEMIHFCKEVIRSAVRCCA